MNKTLRIITAGGPTTQPRTWAGSELRRLGRAAGCTIEAQLTTLGYDIVGTPSLVGGCLVLRVRRVT